jgi:hypothetical protein
MEPLQPDKTCPDCGKDGLKSLEKHRRFCEPYGETVKIPKVERKWRCECGTWFEKAEQIGAHRDAGECETWNKVYAMRALHDVREAEGSLPCLSDVAAPNKSGPLMALLNEVGSLAAQRATDNELTTTDIRQSVIVSLPPPGVEIIIRRAKE